MVSLRSQNRGFSALLLVVSHLGNFGNAIRIVKSPGTLPSAIPAACRASLAADITCGPRLIRAADLEIGVPFNATFLGEYCNSTCTTSIGRFASTVAQRCGDTLYDFGAGIRQSGNIIAAPLKWAHDVACIPAKGGSPSGYCYADVVSQKVETCADCTLKYLAGFLGAPYDSNKIDEEEFTSLASSCGAKPTDFPHPTTTLPLPPPTGTPGPNITCRGGTDYKVKSGDSCESIAQANSMAIDKLLYLNGLDFKCETLTVGSSLCIKDSCKLYKVEPGKTCKQIISDNGFTMVELVHWNPILETACDNMTMMAGRTICITPPGTNEYDGGITATFDDTWTWPSGSWVPGPTQGTPMNTTTGWVPAIPTTTLTTRDGGPAPTEYFENCPLDEGADAWEFMSEECKELLDPYCDPVLTGDPLPPTTFPSSCTDVYWGEEGATAEGARVAETSSALPNGTYSRRL